MCAYELQALNLMRFERIDTLSIRPFRYYVDQIQPDKYTNISGQQEKWFESIFYAVTFWAQFGVRFSFVSVRFGSAFHFFFICQFFSSCSSAFTVCMCVVFARSFFRFAWLRIYAIYFCVNWRAFTHSLTLVGTRRYSRFYFGRHSCFRTCMCCSIFYIWCCRHFISTDWKLS